MVSWFFVVFNKRFLESHFQVTMAVGRRIRFGGWESDNAGPTYELPLPLDSGTAFQAERSVGFLRLHQPNTDTAR